MKNKILIKIFNFLLIVIVFVLSSYSFAQQKKLAQTGMKFLNVSLDARTTAFGDAVTSLETGSSAMFYNPASMGFLSQYGDVTFGTTKFIADINYYNAAVAFAPEDADYGVFGVSFVAVNYGDLIGTVVSGNGQGFLETGIFSPSAFAVGVGYAKTLSEKFSVGANIKYVNQSLGTSVIGGVNANPINGYIDGNTEDHNLNVLAFDFGLIYRTGFKSLNLGMSVRNFAKEVKYKYEGFQLPLIFQIGASFNFADLMEVDKNEHSLILSVDANHPRDYPEQIMAGFEYTFMSMVSFRAGLSTPNDERTFSYGMGLKKELSGLNLSVDYAYTPFGIFNDVHRFTLNFAY